MTHDVVEVIPFSMRDRLLCANGMPATQRLTQHAKGSRSNAVDHPSTNLHFQRHMKEAARSQKSA